MLSSDEAYAIYRREFRSSTIRAIRNPPHASQKELFVALVPLWELISALLDDGVAANPTRDLLLSHFSASGDVAKFLKVASDRRFDREYGAALREASEAVSFTSYFQELVSDSLLLVNFHHTYDYRGCGVAMRCMLEDIYRHLYYKDNSRGLPSGS